jgi:oligoribonuclease NrnB/cAMP/cGMP phosphodiesterase (DHH superfamily)
MFDVCQEREVLEALHGVCESFECFDHHVTAKAHVEGLSFASVDESASGAMLAWRYFHGDAEAPKIVQYVQDMDLWRNELPDALAVHCVLRLARDPEQVAATAFRFDRHWPKLLAEGRKLLIKKTGIIKAKIAAAKDATLGGVDVVAVRSGKHKSEIGMALAEKTGKVAVVWSSWLGSFGSQQFNYSLRSEQGVGADTTELACAFGGGGHKHASAFVSDKQALEFPKVEWKSVEVIHCNQYGLPLDDNGWS